MHPARGVHILAAGCMDFKPCAPGMCMYIQYTIYMYTFIKKCAHGKIAGSVSEIKHLFCALAGCTSNKTVHPEIAPCTLPVYSNNKWLKQRAHTGCTPPGAHLLKLCTPPKTVHPAVEMCTPGEGCTLNFDFVHSRTRFVHRIIPLGNN